MRLWFRKHKKVLAAVVCIIIALAMVLGPLALFFV